MKWRRASGSTDEWRERRARDSEAAEEGGDAMAGEKKTKRSRIGGMVEGEREWSALKPEGE